jgi:hypothetical protein
VANLKTLTINGTTYKVTSVVPADSVTLLADAWEGEGEVYSQVVEVPGVTAHTKVDLQPTAEQLAEFHYKILAFVAENDGGTVTVYSIGDKPEGDHTIQITRTEVEGTGKIRGNTVGTTMPRPDWNQTDPTKADYIKNKPTNIGGGGGATFTPSVDEEGNLSWSNDGGLPNPATVNIKGEKGDPGEKGEKGEQGAQGEPGTPGKDGKDGAATAEEVLAAMPTVDAIDFANFGNGSFSETVGSDTLTYGVVFDDYGRPTTVGNIEITWGD